MSRREILQLRIKGMICPCLLSAEDRTAKESFDFLTRRKVWHIQWHRPMLLKGLAADTSSGSNGDAAGGESGGGGFFKKLVSTVVTSTVGPNICNATLRIMENQYGIAIKILKTDKDNKLASRTRAGEQSNNGGQEGDDEFGIDNDHDHEDDDEDDNTNDGKRKNKRRERVILLRNIGSVEPSEKHSNGIVLYGVSKNSNSKGSGSSNNAVGSNDAKGEELLRFDLKAPQKSNMTDHELKSLRDDMVDHLGVVCKWDRLRHNARIEKERSIQASNIEHSTTVLSQEYDEDGTPLPQRNRAQRAAHFARREVELSQTQRDRDAKKAKYLAMSGGGLKYTAVAMAQRAAGE